MNIWDIVIGAVVVCAVFLAVRSVYKNKGTCNCTGEADCEACRKNRRTTV